MNPSLLIQIVGVASPIVFVLIIQTAYFALRFGRLEQKVIGQCHTIDRLEDDIKELRDRVREVERASP